jgi:MFS family permease
MAVLEEPLTEPTTTVRLDRSLFLLRFLPIVLIANMAILILQVAAVRQLAPLVGCSLDTWTAIIGMFLAGICVGNFYGGKLADRWPHEQTVLWLLLLAAGSALSTLLLTGVFHRLPFLAVLPLYVRLAIICAAICFPTSCLLSMITPVGIRLALPNLQQTGRIVGLVYALGTLGSLAGNYVTGFYLLAYLNLNVIVLCTAGALCLACLPILWQRVSLVVTLMVFAVGAHLALLMPVFLAAARPEASSPGGWSAISWLIILGGTLVGVLVGNFASWWAARRFRSEQIVFGLLTAVILLSLEVVERLFLMPLIPNIQQLFPQLNSLLYWARQLLTSPVLYLPISVLLGMVAALATHLALPEIHRSARAVCLFHALGTVGILLGNYLTGFAEVVSLSLVIFALWTGACLSALTVLVLRHRAQQREIDVELPITGITADFLANEESPSANGLSLSSERADQPTEEHVQVREQRVRKRSWQLKKQSPVLPEVPGTAVPGVLSGIYRWTELSGNVVLGCTLVALTSFCSMALELSAPRLLAPQIGISIWSFTVIVGVCLAGMALGNFLGGLLADLLPRPLTLSACLMVAGLVTVNLLVAFQYMKDHKSDMEQWQFIPRMLTWSLLFFLPLLALGMVSPVVIRLVLRDVGQSGRVAGRIYACSCLGALVGVFVTGWWLISLLGVQRLILLTGLGLLQLSIVTVVLHVVSTSIARLGNEKFVLGSYAATFATCVGGFAAWTYLVLADYLHPLILLTRLRFLELSIVVVGLDVFCTSAARIRNKEMVLALSAWALLLWLGFSAWGLLPAVMYEHPPVGGYVVQKDQLYLNRETNYYYIQVNGGFDDEGREVRQLILDNLIHSYVDPDDTDYLGYDHEWVQAEMLYLTWANHPKAKVLIIGGGGYTLPRWVENKLPSLSVAVVEIDPGVTAAAFDALELRRDTRIHSWHMDGRQFVTNWAEKKSYALVIQDAVNDLSVPFHLLTKEYNDGISEILADDGIYLLTVIDDFGKGELMRAAVRTLKETFPEVHLLETRMDSGLQTWDQLDYRSVYVIYASRRKLDLTEVWWALKMNGRELRTVALEPDRLQKFIDGGRWGIILTDDYAPVDNLMSGIFAH